MPNLKVCVVATMLLAGCAAGTSRLFNPRRSFPAERLDLFAAEETARPLEVKPENPWIVIDLPTALELAGAHDLEIALVREHLEELKALEESARYRFLPTLLPGASFRRLDGHYQETRGDFFDVTRQQSLVGARALLELKLGDAIFDLRATRMERSAGAFAVDETRHRQLLEATASYYDLVSSVQQVQIAREALQFAEALLAYHESRQRQGVGVPVDVRRAEARMEAERVALSSAELGFRSTSAELALLLRLNPRVTLYPGEREVRPIRLLSPEENLEGLIDRALADNPALLSADRRLLASESRFHAAQYGWLIPNFRAEASFDERGKNPGDFDDTEDVFVGLEWEISMGQGARQRRALARRNQAAIKLALQRERLVTDVVKIKGQLEVDEERIEASGRYIQAADSALKLAESRMRAGTGLLLEVLDARVDLTEARRSRLDAITDFNKGQATLLVLTGVAPKGLPQEEE